MRLLVRQATDYALTSECFGRGMYFAVALDHANRSISDADTSIHYIQSGEYGIPEEHAVEADESLLDAIGAFQQAQKAIAETTCLKPIQRQPIIEELARAIDAIKVYDADKMDFEKVDTAAAFGVITRIERIEFR